MDMNDYSSFTEALKKWNIELSQQQLEQFNQYYEMLVKWNSFMNLTSITEFDEVLNKHFLDSLSFVQTFDDLKESSFMDSSISCETFSFSFIDIGTGAGFPGIPLKILFPHSKVVLMDSLNKRIKFLDAVIESLELENIETLHSRAEDLAKNSSYREQFDFAVSRAVANISTLSEYCLPFVKKNGYFISYKSEKMNEELQQSGNAICILGGEIEKVISFTLPDTDFNRNLLMIRKERNTPKKYPRKAGLPSKEPLQ